MDKLLPIGKAKVLLGVSVETLRKWEKEGQISCQRTPGGHRRYLLSEVEALQGKQVDTQEECVAVYYRVSSHDQKKNGDLNRQKDRLLTHCQKQKYRVGYVLGEVASGMSGSRKKLKRLFKLARDREITRLVVEYKDRLIRFNFSILQEFFESHGVEVECVEQQMPKSFEEELVEDIISLMSSYSSRIYGKRSAKNREKRDGETTHTDNRSQDRSN